MAWGSANAQLVAENASLKREIELLRERAIEYKEEIAELKKQLHYTQDALVAKESPEAYRDKKWEQDQAALEEITPEQKKRREEMVKRAQIASQYIAEMEKPLFKDPEDMIEQLRRQLGVPMMDTAPLHENSES